MKKEKIKTIKPFLKPCVMSKIEWFCNFLLPVLLVTALVLSYMMFNKGC